MAAPVTQHRQFQRRTIDVRVQVEICESCASQVSPVSGKFITARITDISGGGAFLITPTYLSRATTIELDIPQNPEVPAGRVRARVMAVKMVDREPRFGLGLRFEDPDNPVVRQLQAKDSAEGEQ